METKRVGHGSPHLFTGAIARSERGKNPMVCCFGCGAQQALAESTGAGLTSSPKVGMFARV